MTGRRTTALDRVVLGVLGVLLVVAGALALAAGAGWTRDVRLGSVPIGPRTLDLGALDRAAGAGWWPAACAGAALVLLVLGVAWLVGHLPGGRVPDAALPGSRTGDRLRVVPDAVARGAQDQLAADPRVRGARVGVRQERGAPLLTGTVSVDARADLADVASLVDRVVREAGAVLGSDLAGRVRIQVRRRGATRRAPA